MSELLELPETKLGNELHLLTHFIMYKSIHLQIKYQ